MTREQRNTLFEIGAFSCCGGGLGVVLAIAFGQLWYVGLCMGAVLASLACDPLGAVRTIGHVCHDQGARLTQAWSWQAIGALGTEGFRLVMAVLFGLLLLSIWAYVALWCTQVLHAYFPMAEEPTAPFALLTIFMAWIMTTACLAIQTGFYDKSAILKDKVRLCGFWMFPISRAAGIPASHVAKNAKLKLAAWWEAGWRGPVVTTALLVVVPPLCLVTGPLLIATFGLDMVVTLLVALAITKRVAILTGSLTGALAGYIAFSSGYSEVASTAVLIGAATGLFIGPGLYWLRETSAEYFASVTQAVLQTE